MFKHYLVHPHATTPALAVCAAHQQGRFWEMSDAIWESAWGTGSNPGLRNKTLLGRENMEVLAEKIGLDLSKFRIDMASERCQEDVEKDQQALAQVGVSGTPAFFINGRYLSGALPTPTFKALIDEELAKAREAVASGVPPKEYYQRYVVERGLKSVQ